MSQPRNNLAYLGVIAASLLVAYPFAMSLLSNKNGFGFVILIGAPIISCIILGLTRNSTTVDLADENESSAAPAASNRAALAVFAFIAAVSLGLIAGLLFASHAHPMDKSGIIVQLTFLGFIVGVIVSVALFASSGCK
jgi:F0F1-type ATP synthase assembly protein I